MRRFVTWLAAALISFSSPVLADDHPVVVELYTSQGCSSCPPADAYLSTLAGREDVIALALHVDYWDYIGWKDDFADPKFTKRQKAYAMAANRRSVYTPQMIVNGAEHVIGNHPVDVEELIAKHAKMPDRVSLALSKRGGVLSISAHADRVMPTPLVVHLVRYEPMQKVKIRGGENAGRDLIYSNIVTEWNRLGDWDTRSPLNLQAQVRGDDPVVVILQAPGPGPIVAASRLR
ncbi:DUF1223 domain-containing protein [Thalassovita aquimarina]|uniref:DUF1223 domain-containing protein n=1 Tax=Thalassovita aquimarina TaxID=2785917 RepID=A0ABS5HT80_9RHOB|nr:DUF1223 domain-containing protein [Thalassovita aquimarina]MBR9651748.1 DUF1223 domain-containing protein [Thalassovita aquimarina]